MRVGKFLEHFKAASLAFDNKSPVDPVLRYLAVGRQLGYASYLILDAITVVDIVGYRKIASVKRLSENAARSWMVGLIFSVIAGAYTLFRLQEKEKTLDRKEGESAVEAKKIEKSVPPSFHCDLFVDDLTNIIMCRERSAARIQLFSDLCDLCAPTSTLGITSFDDGVVGIAGTTSSLIGAWNQWRKTA